jgi:hypothetical protein
VVLDATAHRVVAAALPAQRGVEPSLALDADGQLAQVRFLGGAGWGCVGTLAGTLVRSAIEVGCGDFEDIMCAREIAADFAIAQRYSPRRAGLAACPRRGA